MRVISVFHFAFLLLFQNSQTAGVRHQPAENLFALSGQKLPYAQAKLLYVERFGEIFIRPEGKTLRFLFGRKEAAGHHDKDKILGMTPQFLADLKAAGVRQLYVHDDHVGRVLFGGIYAGLGVSRLKTDKTLKVQNLRQALPQVRVIVYHKNFFARHDFLLVATGAG
jgi:hypothetical protein